MLLLLLILEAAVASGLKRLGVSTPSLSESSSLSKILQQVSPSPSCPEWVWPSSCCDPLPCQQTVASVRYSPWVCEVFCLFRPAFRCLMKLVCVCVCLQLGGKNVRRCQNDAHVSLSLCPSLSHFLYLSLSPSFSPSSDQSSTVRRVAHPAPICWGSFRFSPYNGTGLVACPGALR
jgi:hypothetical protein